MMHTTPLVRARTLPAAAALALALAGCRDSGSVLPSAQAQTAAPQPAVAVQTTRVQRRDVARVIALPGDLVPQQEATLYAKTPGYLDTIAVDKGSRVAAGQVVATLRAPELEADREQARDAYLSAQEAARVGDAAQRKAGEETRRASALADKTRADYRQAPAVVAKTRAQLAQAQSALGRAQEQKAVADAALEESRAQVARAEADVEAARADEHLAELTFGRYSGIYTKDSRLIAKQQVDEAESRLQGDRGRTASAFAQLQAARLRVTEAEAQARATGRGIEGAQAGVRAAREQVAVAEAQQQSAGKQVDVSLRDVDVSRRQQEVTRAQAQAARYQAAAQRSAESRLATLAEYAKIRAPFAGVVTKRFVDPGAFIQTAAATQSAAAIVTVAETRTLRLDIHVPESEARFVRRGTPVEVTALSLPGETLRAAVTRTSDSLDPKTRTLLAEVELPNRDGRLLPGSYVTARVALETHPNVVSVPSAAVLNEKTGKSVFVVSGGKAKKTPVTVGFDNGRTAEIRDGLKGDEDVVVTGRDALTPGAPVKVSPWTPAPKAAGR